MSKQYCRAVHPIMPLPLHIVVTAHFIPDESHVRNSSSVSNKQQCLNCCRFLEFSEVAAFFKQLAPAQSTESAANAAVEALLLSDSNGDRQLDRAEFEQLLVK